MPGLGLPYSVVQPVGSRYTDGAAAATLWIASELKLVLWSSVLQRYLD